MSSERLFLDTVYIQAVLNRADQHHARAITLYPLLFNAVTADEHFQQAGYNALMRDG